MRLIHFLYGFQIIVPTAALAVGWSVFNTMYWAALTDLLPADALSLGAGLLGGALNLLASFLPTVLAVATPDAALAAIGACGLAGAALVAWCGRLAPA